MVRSRPAAATALASPAPPPARFVRGALLAVVLVAAAGCSAAVRGEPSNLGDYPQAAFRKGTPGAGVAESRPAAPRPPTPAPPTAAPPSSTAPGGGLAVEQAWLASKIAFYRAALGDDPGYPPFLATLVPGGPVFVHAIAYLSALASSGVRGPSRWRVGDERLLGLGPRRAEVEGCMFDTGSVWRATGTPAPASLGGGAGLSASDATLVLRGARWLVLSDRVTSAGPRDAGPCHGF